MNRTVKKIFVSSCFFISSIAIVSAGVVLFFNGFYEERWFRFIQIVGSGMGSLVFIIGSIFFMFLYFRDLGRNKLIEIFCSIIGFIFWITYLDFEGFRVLTEIFVESNWGIGVSELWSLLVIISPVGFVFSWLKMSGENKNRKLFL